MITAATDRREVPGTPKVGLEFIPPLTAFTAPVPLRSALAEAGVSAAGWTWATLDSGSGAMVFPTLVPDFAVGESRIKAKVNHFKTKLEMANNGNYPWNHLDPAQLYRQQTQRLSSSKPDQTKFSYDEEDMANFRSTFGEKWREECDGYDNNQIAANARMTSHYTDDHLQLLGSAHFCDPPSVSVMAAHQMSQVGPFVKECEKRTNGVPAERDCVQNFRDHCLQISCVLNSRERNREYEVAPRLKENRQGAFRLTTGEALRSMNCFVRSIGISADPEKYKRPDGTYVYQLNRQ